MVSIRFLPQSEIVTATFHVYIIQTQRLMAILQATLPWMLMTFSEITTLRHCFVYLVAD